MLKEANRQTHNSTIAGQSAHECSVRDRPVRIVLIVVHSVQAVAMVEPRSPPPIDTLLNVRVNVYITTFVHLGSYTLVTLWERLPCRWAIFLKKEIHL